MTHGIDAALARATHDVGGVRGDLEGVQGPALDAVGDGERRRPRRRHLDV